MRAALPAALLAAALALSGCSADPGINDATSTGLQQEVRDVARLAAAHRYSDALTAAATLQAGLRTARTTGGVSDDRARHIQSTLDLVETDLRTSQLAAAAASAPTIPAGGAGVTTTATPTATPTPTPTATATEAATTVAPAPAAPAPAPLHWTWKKHGKGRGGWGKGG